MKNPEYTNFCEQNEILETFNKRGFFALKRAIPENIIHEMELLIKNLFEYEAIQNETIHETCIRLNKEAPKRLYALYLTLRSSIEIDQIRLAASKYFRSIYPDNHIIELGAGLLMGIPFDERIAYDWHQEINYHEHIEEVIHFWIPVMGETLIENGTLSAIEGSHKLGKLPYKLKEKNVTNSVTNLVIQNIDEIKKEHKEYFFKASPGDLIGLHSYVVHRSNKNESDKVRFVISVRLASIKKTLDSFDSTVKA